MLTVSIIAVGKLKDAWLSSGTNEYIKRLGAYCQPTVIEIPEQRLSLNPSLSEINGGLLKEGEAIIGKIPNRAKIVVMCIEGEMISSSMLATVLDQYSKESSRLVIIIGSSHGLSDQVKGLADLKLSLSPMTFPHQLARVIVAEQLYRGFSINAGSKYHK